MVSKDSSNTKLEFRDSAIVPIPPGMTFPTQPSHPLSCCPGVTSQRSQLPLAPDPPFLPLQTDRVDLISREHRRPQGKPGISTVGIFPVRRFPPLDEAEAWREKSPCSPSSPRSHPAFPPFIRKTRALCGERRRKIPRFAVVVPADPKLPGFLIPIYQTPLKRETEQLPFGTAPLSLFPSNGRFLRGKTPHATAKHQR